MNLQSALDSKRDTWLAQVGPDVAKLFADGTRALESLADSALKTGAMFPSMSLPNHTGGITDLGALMAVRPLVVTFYRGGWCPFCSLELRAYQSILPQIEAAGARLVAISPESPDDALSTSEKFALTFDVLTDSSSRLAKALGIHYQLSPPLQALYEKFGVNLPVRNGDGAWSLPLPATYVVDKGGQISLAHVEPDFFRRLDPARVLDWI